MVMKMFKCFMKTSHHFRCPRYYHDLKGLKETILRETSCSTSHLIPELKLQLITPQNKLWNSTDSLPFKDPFWGFFWPGGQVISRYMLDNPLFGANKTVLDFGCGCGACGLSAKRARAKKVVYNDIDEVALNVIKINAQINGLAIDEISSENLIGTSCQDLDLILVGDMLYDSEFAEEVLRWLQEVSNNGKTVLIGDPGRFALESHPMKAMLKCVAKYRLPHETILENNGFADAFVWTFR